MKITKILVCLAAVCLLIGCGFNDSKKEKYNETDNLTEVPKQDESEATPFPEESDDEEHILIGKIVSYKGEQVLKPIENKYFGSDKLIYVNIPFEDEQYKNDDILLVRYNGKIDWEYVDGGLGGGLAIGRINKCNIQLYEGDTVECTVIGYSLSRIEGEPVDGQRDSYLCCIGDEKLSLTVKYDYEKDGMVFDEETRLRVTFDRSNLRVISYEKISD